MKILTESKNGRICKIQTNHGQITTPAFFPDATFGSVKMVSFDELKKSNINQILMTTLHLHNSPGDLYIKKLGGIHSFTGWDRPILTDSGGWQVFSLIHKAKKGKVDKIGAHFVLPNSNKKVTLTPEKSINIQLNLGSDILIVLDYPILGTDSYQENKRAVEITIHWANRAKKQFLKRLKISNEKFNKITKRPLLFSVIQGGNFKSLRKECAKELIKIGFDGYGFGGILLKDKQKTNFELLKQFSEITPYNKIRYGMGIGKPDDILYCKKLNFDFFDCVIPTRNGRHGSCYTKNGLINIKSAKFKFDKNVIEQTCNCIICKEQKLSRAYIRHLLKSNETVGMRACSIHNLYFYSNLVKINR